MKNKELTLAWKDKIIFFVDCFNVDFTQEIDSQTYDRVGLDDGHLVLMFDNYDDACETAARIALHSTEYNYTTVFIERSTYNEDEDKYEFADSALLAEYVRDDNEEVEEEQTEGAE